MIVLDSSFLVAHHNTRDVHHAAAAGVVERLLDGEWGSALLLEYVFLEVVTVLRMRVGLQTAVSVGDALIRAKEVEFVPCSDLFAQAFDTFRLEARSELSFADAAILTAARGDPPGYVATFDSDFNDVEGVTVVP